MSNYKLVKNTEWKEVEINGEMKDIPCDWEVKQLKDLCLKIKDGTHGSYKDYEGNDFELLFSAKNIKNSRLFISENERKIKKEDYSQIIKNGFPQKNDVLMTIVGTIGELMIWDKDKPEAFQRSVSFLRVGEKLNEKYLYFCLKCNYVKQEMRVRTKVGAQPGIYLGDLKAVEVKFPNFQTQASIASILSEQESIIQNIESLIFKYESRFQYLSDELLSGRLRVKEVDGEFVLYKNPEDNWKEVEINGEVKEIPKDWTFDKIDGFIVENNKSKIKAGDLKKLGSFPAFNCSKELSYFYNDYLLDNENLFLSTGGQAAIHYYNGKSAYSTDVYSIKGKGNINNKFLFLMLKNGINTINKMFYGAGLKHLNKKEFKSSDWAIPMKEEQKLISFVLSEQEDLVEQKKELLTKEKQKFNWLLDNLLSGKYLVEEI